MAAQAAQPCPPAGPGQEVKSLHETEPPVPRLAPGQDRRQRQEQLVQDALVHHPAEQGRTALAEDAPVPFRPHRRDDVGGFGGVPQRSDAAAGGQTAAQARRPGVRGQQQCAGRQAGFR